MDVRFRVVCLNSDQNGGLGDATYFHFTQWTVFSKFSAPFLIEPENFRDNWLWLYLSVVCLGNRGSWPLNVVMLLRLG